MKTRVNRLIAAAMILFTIIALLVLFADMFYKGPDFGWDRGSAYWILFAYWMEPYKYDTPTVALIIAWCLEALALLVLFVAIFFSGKTQGIMLGVCGLLLVVGAVLFFCAVPLYTAAMGDQIKEPSTNYPLSLGAAPICNGIFAGVAGLMGGYACYQTIKTN